MPLEFSLYGTRCQYKFFFFLSNEYSAHMGMGQGNGQVVSSAIYIISICVSKGHVAGWARSAGDSGMALSGAGSEYRIAEGAKSRSKEIGGRPRVLCTRKGFSVHSAGKGSGPPSGVSHPGIFGRCGRAGWRMRGIHLSGCGDP